MAVETKKISLGTPKPTPPILTVSGGGGDDGDGGSLAQHGSAAAAADEEGGPASTSSNTNSHAHRNSALHGFAAVAASAALSSAQTRSGGSGGTNTVTTTSRDNSNPTPTDNALQVTSSDVAANQVSPPLGATSAASASPTRIGGGGASSSSSKPSPPPPPPPPAGPGSGPAPPLPTEEEEEPSSAVFPSSPSSPVVAITRAVTGETATTGPAPFASPQTTASTTAAAAVAGPASVSAAAAAAADGGGLTDGSASPVSKRGVPHVYRDYVSVPDTLGMVRKEDGGVTQPFPEKLHEMLDTDEDPSIVAWLPHGRAFIVRKPREFTAVIMPKFFRQTKLTSFQRQLNLYGFRRLTQGADSGAYYHELFLRGRPLLSLRMQRQKVKGTGHKQPADVKTEPNFYTMTPSLKSQESRSPTLSHLDASILQSQTVAQTTNLLAQQPSVPLSIAPNNNFPAGRVLDSSPRLPAPPLHYAAATAAAATPPPRPNDVAHSLGTGVRRDLSPGLRGLHGAANLLKGMAAGLPASSLESPFSLGQSVQRGIAAAAAAAAAPASQHPVANGFSSNQGTLTGNHSSGGTAHAPGPYASIAAQLLLPKDRSNSLLGRVTHIDESLGGGGNTSSAQGGVTQQSAFFWPPSRQLHTNANAPPAPTTSIVIEGIGRKEPEKSAATPAADGKETGAAESSPAQTSEKPETQNSPDKKPIQTVEADVSEAKQNTETLKTSSSSFSTAMQTTPDETADKKNSQESMSQEEAFVEKKVSKKGIETEEA